MFKDPFVTTSIVHILSNEEVKKAFKRKNLVKTTNMSRGGKLAVDREGKETQPELFQEALPRRLFRNSLILSSHVSRDIWSPSGVTKKNGGANRLLHK